MRPGSDGAGARAHFACLFAVVIAGSVLPSLLAAQRNRASSTTTVRAELAAVLLQSRKYDDAAREYRTLLARDESNLTYRLGLARALAWGNRPREAERELVTLRARRVDSATVDTLLRSVRDAIEPRAREAAAWVSERPDYTPYRLAYARALADERYYWAAVAQYDTLLAHPGSGTVPAPPVLTREQAHALIDAGDFANGAVRLRDVLRASPTDTAVRHELALALNAGRSIDAARAEYDTLLLSAPTARLFVERARLRATAGDRDGARYDLLASLDLAPTAPAYLMLGAFAREAGDYRTARAMYRGALAPATTQRAPAREVELAIAEVAREARRVVAFAPPMGGDPGWRLSTDGMTDNLGVSYAASTLRRTFALGGETRVSAGAVHQYLGERSMGRSIDLNAYRVDASAATGVSYGPLLARVEVSGGMLRPPGAGAGTIPVGSATVAAWWNAWEVAVDGSKDAAYPSLLTPDAVRPATGGGADVLTEQSVSAMLGGPLGRIDVAVSARRARLSDGNERVTTQGYLRYALAPGLFAVYDGSRVAYASRSLRYWDPLAYVAHAVGLEAGAREVRGLSWAVRALPGWAWSRELPHPTPTDSLPPIGIVTHSAFQVATSADLSWRGSRWETMAAVSYGLGRVGAYRRVGMTFGVGILQ